MSAVVAGIILGGIVGVIVGAIVVAAFAESLATLLEYVVVGALVGAMVGASIAGSLIYFSKAAIERGFAREKVFLVAVVLIVLLAGAVYAVYALIESTIPEIQDFPGLQHELDDLEEFRGVYFEGEVGKQITFTGYAEHVQKGAPEYNDRLLYCSLLAETANKYVSEDYDLMFMVEIPADREPCFERPSMLCAFYSAAEPCP
jgi:MFS family permease